MTIPGAVSLAAALLALYLAISNANSFAIESWRQRRWFVVLAISACFYSGPNALLTTRAPDWVILACSRISIAAASVHVLGWLHYGGADLRPLRRPIRRSFDVGLLALGALYSIPGVGLTGRVTDHHSPLFRVVYRVAEPKLWGGGIFVLLLFGLAVTAGRYARASLRGKPYAGAHVAALAVLVAAGINDAAVTVGLRQTAYLLDSAFFASVAIVGVVMSQRWADDVRMLDRTIHVREEFVSIASHELRTPLTALMLQVQLLRRWATREADERVAEALRPQIDGIERQVNRFGRLVSELLDLSRIEAGRLRLEIEPVDLAAIVRDAVERLQPPAGPRLERSEIRLQAPGPVVGDWDRLRLEQVVINLLDNALKYGAGKPVAVRLRESGGEAVLTVTDEGIGISLADRDRIFGRFERGSLSRSYGGLGLGLYITRQIVSALGGSIAVSSVPGEGATFTVKLPLRRAASPG